MDTVIIFILLILVVVAVALLIVTLRRRSGGLSEKLPYVGNIERETNENSDYRRVIYTDDPKMQLVLMKLLPGEEIGMETHDNTTQFIRVEKGNGSAIIGEKMYPLVDNTAVIVPHGVRHNIICSGPDPMHLYTIYTPPEHPIDRVQKTK